MPQILLEVAIESVQDAVSAVAGGAGRLELCAALDLGGLTPSLGSYEQVRKSTSLPIVVMIRPRAGDFVYDQWELAAMKRDIEHFLPFNPDGFVFGALTPDAIINVPACRELVKAAWGVRCVFHRAFDKTADNRKSLEDCISLGFTRILTSGKGTDALAGSPNLAKLQLLSKGRIGILPCGKVRASNVAEIHRLTDCCEVHGSFAMSNPERDTPGQRGYLRRSHTSQDAVAACRAVLNGIANDASKAMH